MCLPHRRDHVVDPVSRADHLHLPFRDRFDFADGAEEWLCTVQRSELSASGNLKTAAVIAAERAGSGGEHGMFHRIEMRFRDINVDSPIFHDPPPFFRDNRVPFII